MEEKYFLFHYWIKLVLPLYHKNVAFVFSGGPILADFILAIVL